MTFSYMGHSSKIFFSGGHGKFKGHQNFHCDWFVAVQFLSSVWFFATPCTAALQVSLSFTISWSLLKFMSIKSMMLSSHLTHPAISSSVASFSYPQFFPASGFFPMSQLFASGGQNIVPSVMELQHQSFKWMFRVDFLWDWLVWSPCCPRDCQEFSPAPPSVLWCSAFFMIQLSHRTWLLEKP